MTAAQLVALYAQSRNQRCRPHALIGCDDPTGAFLIDRAVWLFGAFVESETERYRHASTPGTKKGEIKHPSDEEVAEFRRALIEGTPFTRRNVRKRRQRDSLGAFARRGGGGNRQPGGSPQGRRIVQEAGGRLRVDG